MDDLRQTNQTIPPAALIPEAFLTHFCGKCGVPLPQDAVDCPACTHPPTPRPSSTKSYSAEIREAESALWLYFSMLAVSVILIICSLASKGEAGMGLEIFGAIAMSMVVVIWAIARRDTLLDLLSRRPRPRWYLLALVCPAVTFLLASLCVALAAHFIDVRSIDYLKPFRETGASFLWAVLFICLQPAVFEEIAFRGVIQGTLQSIIGPWQAVLASAAMFAILHLSVVSIPHLLFMGLVLAWLRLGSGSIYPGMIVHFLHNLLCLVDKKTGGFFPWS